MAPRPIVSLVSFADILSATTTEEEEEQSANTDPLNGSLGLFLVIVFIVFALLTGTAFLLWKMHGKRSIGLSAFRANWASVMERNGEAQREEDKSSSRHEVHSLRKHTDANTRSSRSSSSTLRNLFLALRASPALPFNPSSPPRAYNNQPIPTIFLSSSDSSGFIHIRAIDSDSPRSRTPLRSSRYVDLDLNQAFNPDLLSPSRAPTSAPAPVAPKVPKKPVVVRRITSEREVSSWFSVDSDSDEDENEDLSSNSDSASDLDLEEEAMAVRRALNFNVLRDMALSNQLPATKSLSTSTSTSNFKPKPKPKSTNQPTTFPTRPFKFTLPAPSKVNKKPINANPNSKGAGTSKGRRSFEGYGSDCSLGRGYGRRQGHARSPSYCGKENINLDVGRKNAGDDHAFGGRRA